MHATVAFYRRLGVAVEASPGAEHASFRFPGGMMLEFDSTDFVGQWDSAWRGVTGGGAILGFSVGSRQAVDATYADLTAAGYRGHQPPYDAFWGARYGIVDDPDGHGVGIMSPIEDDRKSWPPQPPPKSASPGPSS